RTGAPLRADARPVDQTRRLHKAREITLILLIVGLVVQGVTLQLPLIGDRRRDAPIRGQLQLVESAHDLLLAQSEYSAYADYDVAVPFRRAVDDDRVDIADLLAIRGLDGLVD